MVLLAATIVSILILTPKATATMSYAPSPAVANLNLRLPWLYNTTRIGISGFSYGCGDHNSNWDKYALDFGLPFGTPVTAVADGYIHRVSHSPIGYGNYIWITHANGYVSVYAHLGDDTPADTIPSFV